MQPSMFQTIFESAPGRNLVLLPDDPKFTIIAVSNAYLAAASAKREAIVGKGLFEIFRDQPGNSAVSLRASLRLVMETRTANTMPDQQYNIRLPESEGGGLDERYWRPINVPVLGESGKLEYIVHQVEDVSVENWTEKAFRNNARRLEHLANLLHTTLSSIGDGVIATDLERQVTFINPVAQGLTGWSGDAALGKRIEEVLTFASAATGVAIENPISRALRENAAVELSEDTILVSKLGTTIAIEDTAAPIREGDGNLFGAVIVFREIAARRAMEDARKASDLFARSVVESSPDCVAIIGLDGRLISMNQNGCDQMEIDDFSFFLDQPWIGLWGDEEKAEAARAFASACQGSTVRFQGICTTAKGKPRWWEVILAAIRGLDGEPSQVLSVFRDITARKGIEVDLARTREELERSSAELRRSNEDLNHFASAASHDLRSPLKTVLLFTQSLERHLGDSLDTEAKELLGFTVGGARRMVTLIDDLLDYSRISLADKASAPWIDAEGPLKMSIANLHSAIQESGASVTFDVSQKVSVESTQLLQLFQNLIANAIRYRGVEPPCIHLSVKDAGGHWLFSVADNGMGIEPEYFAQIFEPFKRLHGEELPGSGIGLAVCKKIVERNGGELTVQSTPGKGSTFLFTLPKEALASRTAGE